MGSFIMKFKKRGDGDHKIVAIFGWLQMVLGQWGFWPFWVSACTISKSPAIHDI